MKSTDLLIITIYNHRKLLSHLSLESVTLLSAHVPVSLCIFLAKGSAAATKTKPPTTQQLPIR